MKILNIRLDAGHCNYDNMLKQALVYACKQEADVIAFQNVQHGSYGAIRQYLDKFNYISELDEDMRASREPGQLLLVRERYRDVEYFQENKLMVYLYKDKVIAGADFSGPLPQLKNYTFPNGNPKPLYLCGNFMNGAGGEGIIGKNLNRISWPDKYVAESNHFEDVSFCSNGALTVSLIPKQKIADIKILQARFNPGFAGSRA